MLLRSERSNTVVEGLNLLPDQVPSLNDLLQLLNAADVKRVQLESASVYRKQLVSDDGSQFTVYVDEGVKRYGQAVGVVKSAKFRISVYNYLTALQRSASWLYRELLTLTDPLLRNHENIVKLLYWDLVQESERVVAPALIMERADFGSLDQFLESDTVRISQDDRQLMCEDLTQGLLALHNCGIAHGDVKAANALVFMAGPSLQLEGEEEAKAESESEEISKPKRSFIAKLSDFGSVVLLDARPDLMKYYGTPTTNAPELERKSVGIPWNAESMLKCDSYSLGLLYSHVWTGRLDECLTGKDKSVLTNALAIVSELDLNDSVADSLSSALRKLLPWDPNDRISDLSVLFGRNDTFSTRLGRTPRNVERYTSLILGQENYFRYGWPEAAYTEKHIQTQSFNHLQKLAESKDERSGKALFELATAYALGFGTQSNTATALERVQLSAKSGYLPAQALFRGWYEACGTEDKIPMSLDDQLESLCEAVAWGSFYAGASLQRLDKKEFELSRQQFHERGGFNQYFYPRQMPSELRYEIARKAFLTDGNPSPQDNIYDLLERAVIHGDSDFVKKLVSVPAVDPDHTNQYGESLLVLCCKGGHLDTLEILLEAGVKAKCKDASAKAMRDSPLQWLISFDPQHVDHAAQLLREAGALDDQIVPVSWDHPSLDFPGVFPRGSPFHFAVFANDDVCTKALLKYWPKLINQAYPDLEVETPLVHAIKLHRSNIAELLIQHKALNDLVANKECLRNVGAVLRDEALSYNGLYHAAPGILARRCVEGVTKIAPDLVNSEDEHGFTPLMCAAQFSDELSVKALLEAGADVNAATQPEYDHRTALNLLTENKLHYGENMIIELLLQAGADMDKHKTTSGKSLLHLAARDDVAWIARRCLHLKVDIDERDDYGQTPLHVAAMYGSIQVAQVLLDGRANTELGHYHGTYNERDWAGLTPIAVAATRGRRSFIETLLRYGATAIARPNTGQTVFHLAVSESNTDMMTVLTSIPNLCQPQVLEMADGTRGLTALQLCAAYVEKLPHATLLIQAGANVNAVVNLTGECSVLDIVHHAREIAASDDVTAGTEGILAQWDRFVGYLRQHGAQRKQMDDGIRDHARINQEIFSLD